MSIQIIPAIDIIDSKCVRLSQGNYDSKKIYNDNPTEVAKQFENNGIKRIHIVDLDGAKSNKIINYKALESIANNTSLIIDFGGGLKSNEDLHIAFESGAHMVTGGSIAVKDRDTFLSWIEMYKDKIILGADVINECVKINGWKESTQINIFEFIESFTIQTAICTDINCDGMLQGPNINLYSKIKSRFAKLNLIASGGVSCIDDIVELDKFKIDGVIVGKAIYEGKISFKDIHNLYNPNNYYF